jgi:hypothetical protein
MALKNVIEAGTRVGYSANFLRSTGQLTGEVPFLRGVVAKVEEIVPGCTLCLIHWDTGALTRVNIKNLAKVGSAAMSAN